MLPSRRSLFRLDASAAIVGRYPAPYQWVILDQWAFAGIRRHIAAVFMALGLEVLLINQATLDAQITGSGSNIAFGFARLMLPIIGLLVFTGYRHGTRAYYARFILDRQIRIGVYPRQSLWPRYRHAGAFRSFYLKQLAGTRPGARRAVLLRWRKMRPSDELVTGLVFRSGLAGFLCGFTVLAQGAAAPLAGLLIAIWASWRAASLGAKVLMQSARADIADLELSNELLPAHSRS